MIKKQICGVFFSVCLATGAAWADSLELKNGSLIKGTFMGGTQTSISFQVGSTTQSYDVADVRSLKFNSGAEGASTAGNADAATASRVSSAVTIRAGTQILVRTINSIDSTENRVGDRFEASLEEPLTVDGEVVVPKGAAVYGRLEESKTTGTFVGRSELKLALTGMVVNDQTLPLVTGAYELSGKSKGESTAKRTIGGAALGGIIGAIAGGGKGAAIGAGAGAAAGAGSEIITKGDQVKIPSETLLEFTLQQDVSITKHSS